MNLDIFKNETLNIKADIAILVARAVCGYAFILHGWGKIQDPLHWMGPDSSVPAVFQFLAALSEFGGGIAWVIGLLTRLASFGIVCTMIVAAYFHSVILGDSFINLTGGRSYELAGVFFTISLVFLTVGAGRFSLDQKIFGSKSE
ncbi:DoxX family protein [Leptospira licerasiae]|uniref:DoxX family protein n=1 Tax=Leptospira licerasiae str. MMD4847 TaxID=1049971 RepID=A0ABP2RC49_9LEPT|nr:DoxX family protein [Leptospira licerasiae]EID99963.1 DoxX family protein [Leptospira licerasiae serovar Varillal str. VAR 010]EJZ42166.1 DoxX family protein [Leptospira licerasiae str. MMD4847]